MASKQSDSAQAEQPKYLGSGTSGSVFEWKGCALKFSTLPEEASTQELVERALQQESGRFRLLRVPHVVGWYRDVAEFDPTFPTRSEALVDQAGDPVIDRPVLVMELLESLPGQFLQTCSQRLEKVVPISPLALLRLGDKSAAVPRRTTTARLSRMQVNLTGGEMKLNYDECLKLELPADELVGEIAAAASIVHWKLGMDCNDVEFVVSGDGKGGLSYYMTDFDRVAYHHNSVDMVSSSTVVDLLDTIHAHAFQDSVIGSMAV